MATIEITNIYDLQFIHDYHLFNESFVQTNDISAVSTNPEYYGFDEQMWGYSNGFRPIGLATGPFTGLYDGRGYSISGLAINRQELNNIGLFGYLDGALLTHINLINAEVNGGRQVGGLFGRIYAGTLVRDCSVHGKVTGTYLVGGIGGYSTKNSPEIVKLERCSFKGADAGYHVICSGTGAGGIMCTPQDTLIENCYSIGNIQANAGVGSAFGNITMDSLIRFCYGSGNVESISGSLIGGFAGANTDGNPTVENCYWDKETTGLTTDALLPPECGLTTAQMKNKESYVGWDFDRVWDIDVSINDGYPYLNPRWIKTKKSYNGLYGSLFRGVKNG